MLRGACQMVADEHRDLLWLIEPRTAATTAGLGEPPAKDRQLALPADQPLTTPEAHA